MAQEPELTDEERAHLERWRAAAHAMQSGVAQSIHMAGDKSAEPKHLRVGINSAMSDMGGLARLLMDKGIFTRCEYFKAIADAMEDEKAKYEAELTKKLGAQVRLA